MNRYQVQEATSRVPVNISAERAEVSDSGCLLFFVGQECVAAYAPNGWVDFIKRTNE